MKMRVWRYECGCVRLRDVSTVQFEMGLPKCEAYRQATTKSTLGPGWEPLHKAIETHFRGRAYVERIVETLEDVHDWLSGPAK